MHFHPDRGFQHPAPSEITPRELALNRRQWLAAAAAAAALPAAAQTPTERPGRLPPLPGARSTVAGATPARRQTSATARYPLARAATIHSASSSASPRIWRNPSRSASVRSMNSARRACRS